MTTPAFMDRRVPLSGDRTLIVRAADERDIDGVQALYERLDDEARYRRFFSMYRPRREFFEHLLRAGSRGGAVLVAVVVTTGEADGAGVIVAEADFEPLPDGDGELAITVDASWRGWLGPYLLDALVERGAQCGVPNLEAEVLTCNGPMRALLVARGMATVPRDDWTTLRLVIGTAGHVPAWPPRTSGMRVLIEGAASGRMARNAVSAGDAQVLACAGPTGRRTRCPVLDGEPCLLAAGADVIIVANPPDTDDWNELREAHSRVHPGVPVCVELHGSSKTPGAGEVELTAPSSADAMAQVHRAATDERTRRAR